MPPRPDDHEPTSARSAAGRVPPHDLQAEESLLGAMMLSAEAIADAAGVVTASDFYKPAHGHVYDAVHTLYASGQPVDSGHRGRRAAPGRPARRHRRPRRPRPDHVVHAGDDERRRATPRIVEEYALLRRLIGVAGEIAELGYSVPEDVSKALDRAESLVYEVNERRVTDSTQRLSSLLSENLDRLEQLYERGDAITGTPTGYLDLDQLLSACSPARWSSSAPAPPWARRRSRSGMVAHAALEATNPSPVLFFSLEMSNLELSQRLLCAEARVDSTPGAQRPAPVRRLAEDLPGHGPAGRGAASGSTTTPTSRSWRSGPRPGGSRARSATSA